MPGRYLSMRAGAAGAAQRSASRGVCSPYVTVRVVPGGPGQPSCSSKRSTETQARTLFPQFNEATVIIMSAFLRNKNLIMKRLSTISAVLK